MMIKLAIVDQLGTVRKETEAPKSVNLGFNKAYDAGDEIVVTLPSEANYLFVRLDGTLNESLIYVPGKEWRYEIPQETAGTAFNPFAFQGDRHYLAVRYGEDYEVASYRNLSQNTHDQKEEAGAYPHASANVETRNDTTFFARNAIDGILANDDHGRYPYQSWGINQDPEACLRIDFGRTVEIDKIGIVLRGDYPHDSFWTEGKLSFSDGSQEKVQLEKLMGEQLFEFTPKAISWLEFSELKKNDDESPFPALTQLSAYGFNKLK